jgi:hypothetical protein
MTNIRSIAAAFVLAIGLSVVPTGAFANAGELQCRHTAAEYAQAIKHFEAQAAKARAQAAANPLYESDVGYYSSVLADARTCLLNVTPVATAAR